jgi:C4-dicarboxylate-binding protein DctP
MKRIIVTVLIAITISCGVLWAAGTQEAGTVKLNLAHVGAPVSPQQTAAEMFAEKVAEKTGGAVQITIHDSGTLGAESQLQEGVRSGTIDIAIAGTFSHLVPWAGVFETPMLYRDIQHFIDAFSGSVGEELVKAFEDEIGVRPLFIVPHGGFRYITSNKPIRKPSDMVGLKLRNPEVPSFTAMAEAVDAIPIPLDFSELYIALEKGTVEAQHNPVGHVIGQSFYEVQSHLSLVPWGISPHIVSMSTSAWNKLSAEQQSQVLEAASETAAEYPAIAQEEEKAQLEQLKDKMTIIPAEEIDLEAFSAVLAEKGLERLQRAYGDKGAYWIEAIMNVK